jgi:hypothetical protein
MQSRLSYAGSSTVSAYLLLKREYVQAALIFCMMLYLGFNLYAQYNFWPAAD